MHVPSTRIVTMVGGLCVAQWREAMMRTHNHPNVVGCIESGDDLLRTFQLCNKLLEEIQKSLEVSPLSWW
jgi:hypothetical protein